MDVTAALHTDLLPVEVRSADLSERTATIRVMHYGQTTRRALPGGRAERFRPRVFAATLAARRGRIRLTRGHDTSPDGRINAPVIGRDLRWHDTDTELLAEFRFAEAREGYDALEEVLDGRLTAASVGFRPVRVEQDPDGGRAVCEAVMHHVALLPPGTGAYPAAGVLEVRAADPLADYLAQADELRGRGRQWQDVPDRPDAAGFARLLRR